MTRQLNLTKKLVCLCMAIICFFTAIPFTSTTVSAASTPTVTYQVHVQDKGWLCAVRNGSVAGTTGQNRQMEGLKISVSGVSGGVQYKCHVQDIGWQAWKSNYALGGTTGQNKQMEAVQIKLTGNIASLYNVLYRVHMQDLGWGSWVKNGATAGTTGQNRQIEAIEIKLESKHSNNIKYEYKTFTLDTSSLANWTMSMMKAQEKAGGIIADKTVNQYKPMNIVEPLQGPPVNGKSPAKTTIVNAPYSVTFKIHKHERVMGFGASWRYQNQCIISSYKCDCGYVYDICCWEIPLPDPSEFTSKQIANTIKMQAQTSYWINNQFK